MAISVVEITCIYLCLRPDMFCEQKSRILMVARQLTEMSYHTIANMTVSFNIHKH